MTMRNLWQSRRFQRCIIPVLIFLLAFIPRAIYPVSRPMQWYYRAIYFSDALLAQSWAGTYQRYHPGVTTMWLSGIGLRLFAWQRGLSSDQLLGIEPTKPGTLNEVLTAGVVPLAFVIALCIALSYVLLNRIAGRKVAFAGSCLMALDPFYITYSKVLHVDGLLAAFMLTSVLFLLNYLRRSKRLDLVLSGVFAGLAFLSKSPSYFLIPYTALAVGTYRLIPGIKPSRRPGFSQEVTNEAGRPQRSTEVERRKWVHWLWRVIRVLLVWGRGRDLCSALASDVGQATRCAAGNGRRGHPSR